MEDTLKSNLFRLGAIMNAAGFSDERIGRASINNPLFFRRIRESKGFTVRIYDGVVQWISDNWPEGLEWPKDIERPTPKPKGKSDGE